MRTRHERLSQIERVVHFGIDNHVRGVVVRRRAGDDIEPLGDNSISGRRNAVLPQVARREVSRHDLHIARA